MDRCRFYREKRVSIPSNLTTGDRQRPPPSVGTEKWCEHKHSPRPRRAINPLTCGGDLNRCPLTPEQFADQD